VATNATSLWLWLCQRTPCGDPNTGVLGEAILDQHGARRGVLRSGLAGCSHCVKSSGMTASNDPIREVAEILRRHIGQETLQKIANELLEVRGNKTYREIIGRLADELIRE